MGHEEALAELEAKVDLLTRSWETFLGELTNSYVSTTLHIEIAAGKALNVLRGVE